MLKPMPSILALVTLFVGGFVAPSALLSTSLASQALPVLEYAVFHEELAENDPRPLLRIFADGRIEVHRPAYLRRSGDFQMKWEAAEVASLFEALDAAGLLDFAADAVLRQRRQLEERRFADEGIRSHVSDSTWTLLRIRLTAEGVDQELAWPDLALDAERFPHLESLQGLAEIENRLRKILRDPRLTAVQPP